jgi:hypothetical protein
MGPFEKLIEQEQDTHEHHGAQVRFFMSLKEPFEKEAGFRIPKAKVNLSDVRAAARTTVKQSVSKSGVKSVALRKLPQHKLDVKAPSKGSDVAKVTTSTKKKFKQVKSPVARSIKKPKFKEVKLKLASMQKEAWIENIIRGLTRGTQKGVAGAKASWGANKPWLHGFGEGVSMPAETFKGKWGRKLGNLWSRVRGKGSLPPSAGGPKLSPEDMALRGKSDKFTKGFKSGKNWEETAGITKNRKDLMRAIRDTDTGRMSPSSIMKGLNELGITSPEAISRSAWNAVDYMKATKAARATALKQRRNMMIGAGAAGLGGTYLLTRKPKRSPEPVRVQLS